MEYWFGCNYHRITSIKTIIICSLLLGNLPARNVQKHREGSPLELQFLQPNYYLPLSWHRSSAQCKFSQVIILVCLEVLPLSCWYWLHSQSFTYFSMKSFLSFENSANKMVLVVLRSLNPLWNRSCYFTLTLTPLCTLVDASKFMWTDLT